MTPNRNDHLDVLRAYALALVLGYHAFPGAVPGGYLGVDLFFVLSGYFIARAISSGGGSFSPSTYLARRVQRLAPALVILLLACLGAGYVLLLPGEFGAVSIDALKGAVFLSNIFPPQAGYFDLATEAQPLAHLWSLGVEMQAYAILAICIPLLARFAPQVRAWALIFAVSLSYLLYGWLSGDRELFFDPMARLWEFAAGGLFALAVVRRQSSKLIPPFYWLAPAALLPFLPNLYHPGPITVLAVAAGVLCLTWSTERRSAHPALAPLAFLGRASFGIYLWHWPLIVIWDTIDLGPTSSLEMAGLLVASVVAGSLSYRLIERPLLNRQRVPVALGLSAGGIFIVCTLSFAFALSPGASSRVPDPVRSMLESAQRSHPDLLRCHSIHPSNLLSVSEGCTHNDTGEVHVAVWGDSHSAALSGGLIRSGLPFREMSFSGCPPVEGISPEQKGMPCAQFSLDAVREILSREIDTVIITARWPLYLEGEFDNGHGGEEHRTPDTIRHGATGSVATNEDIADAFERSVSRIRDAGKSVILTYPTPAFGWNVPQALARKTWMKSPEEIAISAERYERYVASSRAMLERVAQNTGAILVDATQLFCDDQVCKPVDPEGRILLKDQDHLSVHGADQLANLVLDALVHVGATDREASELPNKTSGQ